MALKHMATSELDSSENVQCSNSTDDSILTDRASRAKDLLGKLIFLLCVIKPE